MKKSIEIEVGGVPLKIETHRWAKQSNGSAVLTYKDNVMLVTANMKDEAREGQGFFPLTVDLRENNYAAGKIPGGFFKREGKPSEREVLLCRLIDRPIRPLFPEDFLNETQVIAMLLSADFSTDYDSLGIIGASVALISSTIPFSKPIAAVKIGRKDGEFIINPGLDQIGNLDMVLQVAGTEKDVVMLEAVGDEFGEDVFKEGLIIARGIISKICAAQKEFINPDKYVVEEDEERNEIFSSLKQQYRDKLREAIFAENRDDRKTKTKEIKDEIFEGLKDEEDGKIAKYKTALHKLEYETFRETLLERKRRNDGRNFDEVRDIGIELGFLPRVHGSAIFTRGETQALATVTLGSEDDAQRMDTLSSNDGEYKRFMLHYNFPPFSVGEVSFLRGAGRREIGHGNLAEKSLRVMFPDHEKFPYTVRVVSDILESNGSSSMATVCAGALALMSAGVPIKKPIAGIAMGLVKDGDDYVVLTDIAGYEDHLGDMDFKITGTDEGIIAIQLDIKTDGLSDEIINKTLEDSKKALSYILNKMKEAIPGPSEKLSDFAPVILTVNINPDRIRDLIGPGGKTIKGLTSTYNVKINSDDDGKVTITAPNQEVGEKVLEKVMELTQVAEIGKVYKGKITRIEDYGLFVELFKGGVGLLHISEISHHRIANIKSENFRIGQEMEVKVISIDKENRIKISRKAIIPRDNPRDNSRD
ncbi:MAG: polyribonucleotide nucleotidyltransferase [Candidatus Aminicenantes bacterium]|nr:polyribonucleotide nucleotidyltransferase [Candidatus Aminicenantes bacterium]